MKDSRNADVEIAFGTGIATAALVKTGTIASSGVITGMVSQLGTVTGLSAIADLGASGAVALGGLLGPVGWLVVGGAGLALILHGAYRGS